MERQTETGGPGEREMGGRDPERGRHRERESKGGKEGEIERDGKGEGGRDWGGQ